MSFFESMARTQAASQERNPFNVILSRFSEAQARRYKEDQDRKKEEADLSKSLQILNKDYLYKQELAKVEEEEKRKTASLESELTSGRESKKQFGEALFEGRLLPMPKKQVTTIGGKPVFEEETVQGAPQEEGELPFKGTPFEALAGGQRFKIAPNTQDALKATELKIKQKQLQELEREGAVTANDKDTLAQLGIPEEERDDYIIKTATQNIRGIKQQIPILERKKTLPAKEAGDLADMTSTKLDLDKNIQMLQEKGLQLGPGFSTRPGAISDILGQMKGADFATLKSSIGRSFQKYRKWATGVAAGYPELNMLAPNYPKATDTNDVFLSKTLDVMKDIDRNQETTLNYFGDAGFAVSKLKQRIGIGTTKQQAQKRTITLPSGKTISIGQ